MRKSDNFNQFVAAINVPVVSVEIIERNYFDILKVYFANGWGVSVLKESMFDCRLKGADVYELAVLDKDGELVYDTPLTDDVLRYQCYENVISAMQTIAFWPEKKFASKTNNIEKSVDNAVTIA